MPGIIEYKASQYYFHQYYANSYYRIYMSLEDWISKNIFRNDSSRVFLSSPEYAFRRRFELTDSRQQDYNKIQASSLNFPFCSYWPLNSGWQADDRIAANTAAQVYKGMMIGNTVIKAASAKMEIPVNFYFEREDDARLAYENLFFNTFNPHYFTNTVAYGPNSIGIPIVIQIRDLQFNPSFKESDWLKQNKIFIISCNFNITSYILKSPSQPDYNMGVNSDGYLIDENGNVIVDENGQPVLYDAGIVNYYIVNNVLLNFNSDRWEYKTYKCNSSDENDTSGFPETGKIGIIYINSFNDDVDRNRYYSWTKKKGFFNIDISDIKDLVHYEYFDSSLKWPDNPKQNVTINNETYKVIYKDTYFDLKSNNPYKSKNKFIWNPYTESYEKFNDMKLDANCINVYGKIDQNTTSVSFLPVISSGNSATINWIYLNQSHDVTMIRVRRQGESEWNVINSNSNFYEVNNLSQQSQYIYEFEFYFEGNDTIETNCISKTVEFETQTNSNQTYVDNSSLIGLKW